MRLPIAGDNRIIIDEAQSIDMLRYAIDNGVNYLDTGYFYDKKQFGHVINVISKALKDGYRKRIRIAANLPSLLVNSAQDFDHYLDEQLGLLQTERIDFYLLGGLNRDTWPKLKEMNILSQAEKAMAEKRIDKLGFSFHDHFQALRSILDDYDNWTLCQFQYSYMDIDHHPGIGGIKYAAEKGLAVVITEALKGGRLTKEPPEPVAGIWAEVSPERTLSEWGLRWIWNHPEVSTVISDMSTMEQVAENVALADSVEADSLSVMEQIVISQVRDAYRKLKPVPCTGCRGCMPCPQGIDVPRIFELYNDARMYGNIETPRHIYRTEKHAIDSCIECYACVNNCGRNIAILDWLAVANQLLSGDE